MNDIGFGCSRLTSNFTEKGAISNLETAFDNGISHFDVARVYGFGLAEGILGKFAKGKRDKITITTKLGLFPGSIVLKNMVLQNSLRQLFRLSKMLPIRRPTQNLANTTIVKRINPRAALESLEISLNELKTDYIDYLLLHEADIGEANSDEMVGFLEGQKKRGMIKAFGIASYTNKIENTFTRLVRNYTVLQTDNSFPCVLPEIFLESMNIEKRFYFSPLLNLANVESLFKKDQNLMRRLSDRLDYQLKGSVIDLFFMQQVYSDPSGIFLFSSSNNKKILDTINCWNRVKALPKEYYDNFSEIRDLINAELFRVTK